MLNFLIILLLNLLISYFLFHNLRLSNNDAWNKKFIKNDAENFFKNHSYYLSKIDNLKETLKDEDPNFDSRKKKIINQSDNKSEKIEEKIPEKLDESYLKNQKIDQDIIIPENLNNNPKPHK